MDKNLENILTGLLDGQSKILNRIDGMDKKLGEMDKKIDSVYGQTIRLTEGQEEIKCEVVGLRDDLSRVEVVTSQNLEDIKQLKAIK